jgi:hypothetical protein
MINPRVLLRHIISALGNPWQRTYRRSLSRARTALRGYPSPPVLRLIARHARRMVQIELSAFRWTLAASILWGVLSLGSFSFIVIRNRGWIDSFAVAVGMVSGQIVDIVLYFGLRTRLSRLVIVEGLCAITGAVAAATMYRNQDYSNVPAFGFDFWSVALGWILITSVHTFHNFMLLMARRIMDVYIARNYPVSKLVDSLVFSCWSLANQNVWTDVESKRRLMETLEVSAIMIQTYIPQRLLGFDRASETWISDQAKRVSAALREYKKWVYSPMPITRAKLEEELRFILISVTIGEWHHLPQSEPVSSSASALWVRTTHIITAIIQSSLPLLLLLLWHITPFRPAQDLFEKLAIAAVAIGAVYLIVSIDPGAETKIRGATSLINIFTKGGAGEK